MGILYLFHMTYNLVNFVKFVYFLFFPILTDSVQVLIMDKVTVKVLSHCCKMSDITDQGISCKNQS